MVNWLFERARSLKLRLALTGALLIMASVGLTVHFVLHEVGVRTEGKILDLEHADTRRLASVMSARLINLQLALRHAATAMPAKGVDDWRQMGLFLESKPVLKGMFDNIFAALPDGRVVAVLDDDGFRDPLYSIGDRPYFQRTLKQARPVMSEPLMGRESRKSVIILTMPVFDAAGKVRAVLGGALPLSMRGLMAELDQDNSTDDQGGILTVVIDVNGRLAYHPDPQWVLRDAADRPMLMAAMKEWERQGRPVEPQGLSFIQGEYLVAMAGVPDADWVVIRVASLDMLLSGLKTGAQRAVWMGFVVAMAGGLVILLLTLQILKPLQALEVRAKQLIKGDLPIAQGWPQVGGEIGQLSGVLREVMQLREASQATSAQVMAQMQAVMDRAPVGLAFTRDNRFELVSVSWARLFGYTARELTGAPARVLYESDEFFEALGLRAALAFANGRGFSEEVFYQRRDGSHFWGRLQGALVRDDQPVGASIWIVEDITDERRHREHLLWSSTRDSLTEVYNRRAFEAQLTEHLNAERTYAAASALFIDLDWFKAINDTAGHAAGDEVLREVARRISGLVRGNDVVARIGGDEFAVLLRSCDVSQALQVAEKIRESILDYRFPWSERPLGVGVSIGLVGIAAHWREVQQVMDAADRACYAAKHAGRNRVCISGDDGQAQCVAPQPEAPG